MTSGTLSFTILPDSIGPANWPDWDWLLYQTTDSIFCTHFVGGNQPFACNGSSSAGPYGATGLNATGTSNSVPAGPGNPYCPLINAVAGEYYYLMLNNFNVSSSGFRIHLGGSAVLDCDIVNPPTAVVAQQPISKVVVSPNPANDWVSITVNGLTNDDHPALRIVDVHGKFVLVETAFENGTFRMNLQNLAPGMYFFEVRSDLGELQRGKFLKR